MIRMQGGPVCTTGKASPSGLHSRPANMILGRITYKDGKMSKAADNRRKAIEKWRKNARKASGGFRLLPREILLSEAFGDLSGAAVRLLLLAWNQVYFDKHNKLRESNIYLTHDAAMAIGIGSSQTITKARNELVEKGFLEVSVTGSVRLASVFRISERWRKYPYGHQREDSRPAGRNIFPKSSLWNPDHPIILKRTAKKSGKALRAIPSV